MVIFIRDGISVRGKHGIGMIDTVNYNSPESSESFNSRNEVVVQAEIERYIFQTRNILLQNKEFLEKVADALAEKETLLSSDIKAIRESVTITKCIS